MSSALRGGPGSGPLARAHDDVDELLAAELSRWESGELLDAWRELERLRNRLAAAEHRFVVEAEGRGLSFEHGARDIAALIRGLLRVGSREAAGRVRAADAAAGRTTLTGEPTPAPFPDVAAAQASGAISPRHAQVVVAAVESLPDAVQASRGAQVEQDLVGYAHEFDPQELGKIALRTTALLDQDGSLTSVDERHRRRGLTIRQRPDGSASIAGETTAELAERLLTVLDPLAAPKPAAEGVRDLRTAPQRNHDGLLDALDLVGRANLLPSVGGISTTVLLTMTTDAWATGCGTATTGHGGVIPAREAIRIAGGDARAMTVTFNPAGAITDYTDARRLFTENQRLAMIARDGGCTFPGCDAPPAWCQAHHVVDHVLGGPTTVDNGALVCGHDHREQLREGWRTIMINSRPAWIPPPWVDSTRTPRFNRFHEQR